MTFPTQNLDPRQNLSFRSSALTTLYLYADTGGMTPIGSSKLGWNNIVHGPPKVIKILAQANFALNASKCLHPLFLIQVKQKWLFIDGVGGLVMSMLCTLDREKPQYQLSPFF